mmetsp:Transcript_24131/g.32897  ORF Transcript_24131/g.32897 Transcript_24131/m.32897 type:complete len:125 (-) Transcript_24131:724-1098(-)
MGWVIKSVILQNDALFEGGTIVMHPNTSTNEVSVPIKKEKNTDLTVDLKILIGAGMHSQNLLIHHVPRLKLSKFAMFQHIAQEQKLSQSAQRNVASTVRFTVKNAPFDSILQWAQKSFQLQYDS